MNIQPQEKSTEQTTRVLVVDDDRLVREVLADFLGMEGFVVQTAEDGDQGVAALEQEKFDVVISDLRMPRKGGLGLLRDVARLCPEAVTVVMTGFGTVEDAVDVMSQGAHYLLKPFKIDEVIALVRQGLARRREQANGIHQPVGLDREKGLARILSPGFGLSLDGVPADRPGKQRRGLRP